jgi:hypothetical protein
MQTSESLDKIAPAFVKAQAECESAKKANENGAFKQNGKASKYAGLPEVVAACLPACNANGIGVLQILGTTTENKMGITTRLIHESGQWIEGFGSIPLPKQDPQGYGSASTYARRYHLAAMMGIIQEDDDGNASSNLPHYKEPEAAEAISDTQCDILRTLIEASGSNIVSLCQFYKIKSLPELPASKFAHAEKSLKNKLTKGQEA